MKRMMASVVILLQNMISDTICILIANLLASFFPLDIKFFLIVTLVNQPSLFFFIKQLGMTNFGVATVIKQLHSYSL